MLVKPASLSTVKTRGQYTRCGKDPPACISFLDFPHAHFQSCPSRPARHMPHLAQVYIPVTPFWASGCLGGGDAHICTGSINWLAQTALGSRILTSVLQRDGQSVWDPCFEQSSMTKWTGWRGPTTQALMYELWAGCWVSFCLHPFPLMGSDPGSSRA